MYRITPDGLDDSLAIDGDLPEVPDCRRSLPGASRVDLATNLGIARGSGGTTADVQLGPGDDGYAGYGATVVRATGSRLIPAHAFSHVGNGRCCFYMQDFAFSPSGALYADNLGESAFGEYQEILTFSRGETTVLWKHRVGE